MPSKARCGPLIGRTVYSPSNAPEFMSLRGPSDIGEPQSIDHYGDPVLEDDGQPVVSVTPQEKGIDVRLALDLALDSILPVRVICPSCQCAACRAIDRFPKSPAESSTSCAHKRGVSPSSRTLGAGCGGRDGVERRTTPKRTAKSCGPDASTPASSLRLGDVGPYGLDTPRKRR
jgi:hypothetical protein